jgi:hypothetical protein
MPPQRPGARCKVCLPLEARFGPWAWGESVELYENNYTKVGLGTHLSAMCMNLNSASRAVPSLLTTHTLSNANFRYQALAHAQRGQTAIATLFFVRAVLTIILPI